MPTYDPTLRGASSIIANASSGSVTVPIGSGTTAGDLFIVTGIVGPGVQINPPDGTWTRLNGVVSHYQCFSKIYAAGMNLTFSWGTSDGYVFNSYSIFSAAGGTISVDQLIQDENGTAHQITSKAVTPTQNALVLVDYVELVTALINGPAGLTQVLNQQGGWGGTIYVTAGVTSLTYTAVSQAGGNWAWGVGTFSLISSLVNPVSPPFVDDEAAFTPGVNQTAFPPFVDDELAFTPGIGIGAMHTTTSNLEVALVASSAAMRASVANAELAIQAALSSTHLRVTQDSVEIALQAQPPIMPVDFEIQTPGVMPDSGQQWTGDRLLLTVDCQRAGLQQILTPILIIDGVEYTLPQITNSGRGTIDMPIHGFHGRFWEGVRLVGRLVGGRVEVFRVEAIIKQGVPSPRGG